MAFSWLAANGEHKWQGTGTKSTSTSTEEHIQRKKKKKTVKKKEVHASAGQSGSSIHYYHSLPPPPPPSFGSSHHHRQSIIWARRKCALPSELVVSWRWGEGSKVTETHSQEEDDTNKSIQNTLWTELTDWATKSERQQHSSIARPHICRAHLSQQQQQQQ